MYATLQLQAVSMVSLCPTISFKLQIDQFRQEFELSEADSCPKPYNIDSDKSSRIPFTIFLQFSHPHIQISACQGKIWSWSLHSTPSLICKKTMLIYQQLANTNICFSHFSDKFISHFSIPKSKFWRVMGRNGHKPTFLLFIYIEKKV